MVETTTQYLEYLYDLPSDEDNDWQTEDYHYKKSGINLVIQTRYSAVGVSRSTWEAAFIMGEYVESNQDTILKENKSVRVLELGSGTGLGGIHFGTLMKKVGVEAEIYMTDICAKSLRTAGKNLIRN